MSMCLFFLLFVSLFSCVKLNFTKSVKRIFSKTVFNDQDNIKEFIICATIMMYSHISKGEIMDLFFHKLEESNITRVSSFQMNDRK